MFGQGNSSRRNPLPPKVRQREVYPTGEIPHKWAHATQPQARNPQGNLYFRGDTIYSYRDSWPLARIYRKRGAALLVLLNSETASVTTSGHQRAVDRAGSHMPSVSVPYVVPDWGRKAPDHDKNLAHFAGIMSDSLAKANRAMQERTVLYLRGSAIDARTDWQKYAAFFGIRRKVPADNSTAWQGAVDRAKVIETPDPVRDAKRFKAQERRKTAKRAELQAAYDAHCEAVRVYNAAVIEAHSTAPVDATQVWRDTGRYPAAFDPCIEALYPRLSWKLQRKVAAVFDLPEVARRYGDRDGPVLLRVNGEQIETSQGARIPLDHAPRIWRFVKAVIARGEAYQRNGHTEHAGEFAIDRIEADGTMKAGCHVIPYAEIERMARTLGYIPAEHASAQGG